MKKIVFPKAGGYESIKLEKCGCESSCSCTGTRGPNIKQLGLKDEDLVTVSVAFSGINYVSY